ncbi:MAG TPA: type III-B CRISPR module RAMP protein Cmr4 [Planctomycetota bacterium]|nr:type III-B CRISPR module RAMP protein Cmr4 [Planctomycetota bacterium]
MFKREALLFLYAETPVHWGTGSSIGAIDLPIQRERHTGYPMGQGAGIKGSVRDLLYRKESDRDRRAHLETIFGPETGAEADKFAGAVAFGDAKLILFPIRSLRGTFAYATSRPALERLARDAEVRDWKLTEPEKSGARVTTKSSLVLESSPAAVILEESRFAAKPDSALDAVAEWLRKNAVAEGYWAERITSHLVLLPETDFQYFVRTSTVVEAHTRIDDTKGTVADGALFQAEFVPCDSLFYVPLAAADPFGGRGKTNGLGDAAAILNKLRTDLDGARMQTGADATTGRGIVRLKFMEKGGAR